MTGCGVSREATIADYGLVLSGELDDGDWMLYVAAATDAAGASGLSVAEVLFDPGPGYARRFGGMRHAGVDVVGQ
jgi:hypothetical protein